VQIIDGRPVFAATDLVGYLACEHLTGLELAALAGLVPRPTRLDPEIDLIAKRGVEHERRYLEGLEVPGKRVVRIEEDSTLADRGERLRAAAEATAQAARSGADVIYQATFFDGRWLGLADFLVRVERPSLLGGWSYEVVDTKLARHVKASALLQMCSYVEQLTRLQGVEPEMMHVALGGSARTVEHHRVADYMAYYRAALAAFEARVAVAGFAADGSGNGAVYPPIGTYPEPAEHCDVCRWSRECQIRRRADDDLSLVANASIRIRKALKSSGVSTRRGLAAIDVPPLPPARPVEGVSLGALAVARAQASIQVRGGDAGKVLHEWLEPARLQDGSLEPNRGMLVLPEPRPGDLFYDIEGDPFAMDDGVEYLHGILEPGVIGADGEPVFHAFWAVDGDGLVTREAEKRAFEQTIDLMTDRLAKDPSIHIYHYAPYEPSAAGRLMGRHATREAEVDRLLRGGAFVDLFRVVRQGLRASVESYSIKKLEPLYSLHRQEGLRDAGSSIVAFEKWLAEGETAPTDGAVRRRSPQTDETLHSIETYNRDDCVSNWQLRDWLEARRPEFAREFDLPEPLPRPAPAAPDPGAELSDRLRRVAEVAASLAAGVPDEPSERSPEGHGRWLLAQLLGWHRREDKAGWWRFYYLLGLTDAELIEEREPIGGLRFVGEIGRSARSTVYRYQFPEQEYSIGVGSDVVDPATKRSPGEVVAVDEAARTIDLKRGSRRDGAHPTALVEKTVIDSAPLQDGLLRIGEWVAEHGIDASGRYEAARQLLMRRRPRMDAPAATPPAGIPPGLTLPLWPEPGADSEALCRPGEDAAAGALRIAPNLAGSYLAVQGPPGSGKTYLGAQAILELVRLGRKVGVTANSHKVVGHLLDSVAERASELGVAVRIGQKTDRSGECASDRAQPFGDYGQALAALENGELDVLGGTAWLWSREEFTEAVDVLVVDEAGQLALANAIAVSGAARNLILLGDPQQLDQPLQGTHPPGAEASALGHVLAEHTTMPPDRGLFLELTRRLHPDVCRFTSEAFYEGRLASEPRLATQDVAAAGAISGTGVRYVPVEHEGNVNASPEEASVVARIVRDLTDGSGSWTDAGGETRRLGVDDILIVAPYNAQVSELERMVASPVGTVDRFQGQEAPISIYSMATSRPEDAPRGMEFLYSLNRLNVATSRARGLAVVVASPALMRVRARTPRQMRLANALCLFLEIARKQAPAE
jgi:predicted RecB family nuclease